MDASINSPSISSNRATLPFTYALLPKESDKTWIKVAKIALTIFCACTIVIPLLTLLADGIYYLHYNLSTPTVSVPVQKEEEPPAVSMAPNVIEPPIIPAPTPEAPRSPIARVALAAAGVGLAGAALAYACSSGDPSAIHAVAVQALAQSPSILETAVAAAAVNATTNTVAYLGPAIAQAKENISEALHNISEAVFNRTDTPPANEGGFNGLPILAVAVGVAAVAGAAGQVPQEVPEDVVMPEERRRPPPILIPEPEEKYPESPDTTPLQIFDPSTPRRAETPRILSRRGSRAASPHLSTPRERKLSEDGYELVAEPDRFVPTQRKVPTTLESISSELASILFDPGNPEKGKKYHYALHAAQKRLNENRDLDTVLEMLAEVANAQGLDPIAHYRGKQKLSKPHFPINAFCALSALTNFEGYPSIRAQYAHHLTHLREALNNPEQEQFPRAKAMLESLCHTKYAGVYMYPHLESFVLKALRAPQGHEMPYSFPELTLQNLASEIGRANARLETVPPSYRKQLVALGYEKFKGTLGFGFDPTATANTPWVHSRISLTNGHEEREITILRHGTPTTDPNFLGFVGRETANAVDKIPGLNWLAGTLRDHSSRAEVIPEYKGFLAGKRVLYVNHQEHDEQDREIHGEGDRSRAVQELEETHRDFHYLALPMDGRFWKTDSPEFKRDVLTALREEKEGFAIPAALRGQEIFAEELWQKVQTLYFNNQEPATLVEKRDFLMLFYSYLKTSLMIRLNVSYMNASCKDDKDRGNASKLVDQMIRAVQTNTETHPAVLREIFFSALAPFIIKNEAILPKRLNLALSVLNRIAHLTPEQQDSIRNDLLPDDYRIVRQGIPKEDAKWGSVVKNPKDFLALVRQMQADEEEEIFDEPNFQQRIASTYRKNELWNLASLRQQIIRDLPRTDIRLDGHRVETFGSLIGSLGLNNLPFDQNEYLASNESKKLNLLSMLHQGIVGPITESITLPFLGNPLGMTVRNAAPRENYYPTRIEANSEERSILATQDLELAFPNEESEPIPLQARVRVNKRGEASMMWRFLSSQQK